MPTRISIQPEAVVDPRGDIRGNCAGLAPRLPSLNGKQVLLFDNARATGYVGIFGPIYRWLSEYLEREQRVTCSYKTQNLLQGSKQEFVKLAEEISRSRVHAVVIALCKAGVTQPSSLFTAELERGGKPCVQICTDIGYPLACVTASIFAPGLPIVMIQPATGETDNFGKTQVDAIIPEIVSGLSTDPATLPERFRTKFPSGPLANLGNGKIQLPSITASATYIQGSAAIKINPGRFARDLYEKLCASEMCDGLPVIPPAKNTLARCFNSPT